MLESNLCELLPLGAMLLVRKLGEVTGIWDVGMSIRALSACAHTSGPQWVRPHETDKTGRECTGYARLES
jgi:hypothetical protein